MAVDFTTMSSAERLNTIHRLRLLRNTTGEMSAYTKIELRNNSFSRKSPFIAQCIYSEFCRNTRVRTGLDLSELMNDYAAASDYYARIVKTRRAQPEFLRGVLRCLLDEEFASSDESQPYRSTAGEVSELDAALLTLLVLEMLPTFQAKPGDVDPHTHLENLWRLREYVWPLYNNSRMLRFAPYLTDRYTAAVRKIHEGDLFSRLELIKFAKDIFANLENNYLPEAILQSNLYVSEQKIHPDLMQGVWVESDACGATPVYWVFEELGNDYLLTRCRFDRSMRRITETRYEVILYVDETSRLAFQTIRQSVLEAICTGKRSIPEQEYMCGLCRLSGAEDLPDRIDLEFTSNRYDDFPHTLLRVDSAPYVRLVETASAEEWTVDCQTGIYTYLPVERVVGVRHFYVECESEPCPTGGRKIVSWYRIPRTGLLEQAESGVTMARILHDNRTYVVFIPMNLSFDVTDEASRSAAGIDLVREIEVTVPDGE